MGMFGLDLLTISSLLVLSSGPSGCSLPAAPRVLVDPVTEEIVYDYSKDSAALGLIHSDTVSPYGPGVDLTTGGLREDHPTTSIEVKWKIHEFPSLGLTCLYYDEIKVTVTLRPKIYVAKDYNHGACRKAIIAHERRHVKVDRAVMNRYAQSIGESVKKTVDSAGAFGPFTASALPAAQENLVSRVQEAIEAVKVDMEAEMADLQSKVDSREEYDRVSRICHGE